MHLDSLKLFNVVALGCAFSLGANTAVLAAPINFTWNPAATGNTTAGAFTADQFTLDDFSTINVPTNPSPSGSVTASGFLEFTGFTLAGTPVSTVHMAGAGGYGLYETFVATSHLSAVAGGLSGSFDSFTANVFLYSTVHGLATYTFTGPGNTPVIHLPTAANPVLLASESGPAGGSPNTADITGGVPSGTLDTTWNDVFSGGFFIDPPFGAALDLKQVLTATTTVVTTSGAGCATTGTNCLYQIRGGDGTGNFLSGSVPVPEPAPLALFGFALLALAALRRLF